MEFSDLSNLNQDFFRMGVNLVPLHSINPDGSCTCHLGHNCNSKGKHPTTPNGLKNASNDFEKLKEYTNVRSNFGVLTGKINDIEVIDIDVKNNGRESLAWLISKDLIRPTKMTILTGSLGLHLYYKYSNRGLKNKVNLLPGIDFRTDGGYVVAPGSLHHTLRRYKLIEDFSFKKYLRGEYDDL